MNDAARHPQREPDDQREPDRQQEPNWLSDALPGAAPEEQEEVRRVVHGTRSIALSVHRAPAAAVDLNRAGTLRAVEQRWRAVTEDALRLVLHRALDRSLSPDACMRYGPIFVGEEDAALAEAWHWVSQRAGLIPGGASSGCGVAMRTDWIADCALIAQCLDWARAWKVPEAWLRLSELRAERGGMDAQQYVASLEALRAAEPPLAVRAEIDLEIAGLALQQGDRQTACDHLSELRKALGVARLGSLGERRAEAGDPSSRRTWRECLDARGSWMEAWMQRVYRNPLLQEPARAEARASVAAMCQTPDGQAPSWPESGGWSEIMFQSQGRCAPSWTWLRLVPVQDFQDFDLGARLLESAVQPVHGASAPRLDGAPRWVGVARFRHGRSFVWWVWRQGSESPTLPGERRFRLQPDTARSVLVCPAVTATLQVAQPCCVYAPSLERALKGALLPETRAIAVWPWFDPAGGIAGMVRWEWDHWYLPSPARLALLGWRARQESACDPIERSEAFHFAGRAQVQAGWLLNHPRWRQATHLAIVERALGSWRWLPLKPRASELEVTQFLESPDRDDRVPWAELKQALWRAWQSCTPHATSSTRSSGAEAAGREALKDRGIQHLSTGRHALRWLVTPLAFGGRPVALICAAFADKEPGIDAGTGARALSDLSSGDPSSGDPGSPDPSSADPNSADLVAIAQRPQTIPGELPFGALDWPARPGQSTGTPPVEILPAPGSQRPAREVAAVQALWWSYTGYSNPPIPQGSSGAPTLEDRSEARKGDLDPALPPDFAHRSDRMAQEPAAPDTAAKWVAEEPRLEWDCAPSEPGDSSCPLPLWSPSFRAFLERLWTAIERGQAVLLVGERGSGAAELLQWARRLLQPDAHHPMGLAGWPASQSSAQGLPPTPTDPTLRPLQWVSPLQPQAVRQALQAWEVRGRGVAVLRVPPLAMRRTEIAGWLLQWIAEESVSAAGGSLGTGPPERIGSVALNTREIEQSAWADVYPFFWRQAWPGHVQQMRSVWRSLRAVC